MISTDLAVGVGIADGVCGLVGLSFVEWSGQEFGR